MSNLLYHKELTEEQWEKIKYLFEKPRNLINERMQLLNVDDSEYSELYK